MQGRSAEDQHERFNVNQFYQGLYFRKMNNKEFVVVGDTVRIDEVVRKLRTETAFSVKRTQADLLNLRKSDKARFEEQVRKIMANLGMLVSSAKFHKYIMKYLRRTDKKYLPLQRLVNPQMIANADYYRESQLSCSFSRELEKSLQFDDENLTQKNQRLRNKKQAQKFKRINRRRV
jgi:hypothetical protein